MGALLLVSRCTKNARWSTFPPPLAHLLVRPSLQLGSGSACVQASGGYVTPALNATPLICTHERRGNQRRPYQHVARVLHAQRGHQVRRQNLGGVERVGGRVVCNHRLFGRAHALVHPVPFEAHPYRVALAVVVSVSPRNAGELSWGTAARRAESPQRPYLSLQLAAGLEALQLGGWLEALCGVEPPLQALARAGVGGCG